MKSCTASKAALLAACQFPFSGRVAWEESKGKAAQDGDELHDRLAADADPSYVARFTSPPTTKWMRVRLEHGRRWIDTNMVRGWKAEEAYSYDPETGTSTLLGHAIGRDYEAHGRKPGELAGSADLAWLDDAFVSADWKSGRFVTDSVWHQMGWLSLFGARHYGVTKATALVLHVTEHGVEEMRRDFSRDDLNRIEDAIRAQLRAIPDAWPEYGVHCSALYCPARSGCEVYRIRTNKDAA